jgi:hypothetical protein
MKTIVIWQWTESTILTALACGARFMRLLRELNAVWWYLKANEMMGLGGI